MRGFPFAPSDNSDNLTQVPERGVPRLLLVGALVYAAAHLPFLAQSLEDIDSINFALGLRHYDISQHQPHPPGYPVYIAIARVVLGAVHLVHAGAQPAAAEALALALVSAVSGALAVVCLGMIFAAFDRMSAAPARRFWWWATALAAGSPLFWISGLRPMSDLPGLSLALLSLALMLCSGSRVSFLAGALVAGLSAGVRVQTALLTVPTMALLVWARRMRARDALEAVAALGAGGLLWAVPLLWLSGGVNGYLAALGSQAGEDFAWVEMLWANPTPRRLALALTDSFLRPWSSNGVAATVLALAAIGFVVEVLTRPAVRHGGIRALCPFSSAAAGDITRALRAAAPAASRLAGIACADAGGPPGIRVRLRDRGGLPGRRRADVRRLRASAPSGVPGDRRHGA
jgi:hypothetical protein